MARFLSVIGFGSTREVAPGVWEEAVKEVKVSGSLLRNNFRTDTNDKITTDTTLSNSISIMGSNYIFANLKSMLYVKFEGELWVIDTIDVQRPRLILGMGGVYNGPSGTTPNAA